MKRSKFSYRRLAELIAMLGLIACLVTFFRPSPVSTEPEPKPLTEAQKAEVEQFFDQAKTVGSTFVKEFPNELSTQIRHGNPSGVILVGLEVRKINTLVAERESLTAELEALDPEDESTEKREEAILQRLDQIHEELLEIVERMGEI